MSAEVQESSGKRKRQAEENDCQVDFYPDGGYEHVVDYFLYTLYHAEQASDDGNKHAEQWQGYNWTTKEWWKPPITLLLGADNKLYYYEERA